MRLHQLYRRPSYLPPLDLALWGAALAMLVVAGLAASAAAPAVSFFTALTAVAVTSAVMGRAVDQLGGRLRPAVIGTFQAVIGNVPELIIGIMALKAGLILVVQAAVIGSALNLLLLGNGLAFLVGGLRHRRSLSIEPERTQITRVALILLVTILMIPALAVLLHSPAAAHPETISYVSAGALLAVFVISLPTRLRSDGDMPPPEQRATESQTEPWPLWLVLTVLGASGLLIGVEADWFTDALEPAVATMEMSTVFVGLFIVATVGNLSQIGPAVQMAWRGDADTATAITMEGALQVILLLAPLLTIMAPLLGVGTFTLIFPPMMVVATLAAVILVVFVTIDGKVNAVEGAMLLALYTVLGALFWWG
ncbi:hypothetical protein [Nocardiopsis sp. MG754419]|uniref:hypothetical protein n=1 Tax=Nocardiopsis sp. MG754419 TaxID=2259865 RepID=UPI001BAB78B8|nr:hypothetical protein [Nocardiopsis sp. MG754419]MBR8743689.1 sodium:proton exchanger [Nocardiopsis sp. MG754419]